MDVAVCNAADGIAQLIYVTKPDNTAYYDSNGLTSVSDVAFGTNNWDTVDHATLPTDYYFRNAWTYDTGSSSVIVDMAKARAIHLEELKKKRLLKWKSMGVPENINSVFDTNFDAGDQTILGNLRGLESYDLTGHSTPAEIKADVPNWLT